MLHLQPSPQGSQMPNTDYSNPSSPPKPQVEDLSPLAFPSQNGLKEVPPQKTFPILSMSLPGSDLTAPRTTGTTAPQKHSGDEKDRELKDTDKLPSTTDAAAEEERPICMLVASSKHGKKTTIPLRKGIYRIGNNTRKYVEICFSGRKINPLHAIIWVDSTNVKILPYESSKVYIGETVIPPEGAILKVGCEFAISGTKLLLTNPDGSIPTVSKTSTSTSAASAFSLVPSSKDAFIPSLRCGTLPMRPDTPTFPFSFGKDDLSVSTPILASSPLKSRSVNSNLVNDELTQFTPFEFGRSASRTNLSNSNIEDINPQNAGPLSSLDHNSVSKSSGSESTENDFKKLSMSVGPLKDSDNAVVLDPPPKKKHKKPPSPPPPLSSHCSSVQNTSESQGGKDSVTKTNIDADSGKEEESKISIYFFGVWALRAIKMSRKYAKVYESYFYQNKYGMSISTIENKVMNFAYKSRSEVCDDFIKIASDSIVVNIGNQALCSLAIKFYKEVSRLFSTKGVSFTQFDFSDILNVDDNSFVTLDDFGSSRENSENEADDNDDEDDAGNDNNNDDDIDMNSASVNDNIGIGDASIPILGRDPIADNILKSISQGELNKPAKGDTKHKKSSKSAKEASTSIERDDTRMSNVKGAKSKISANVQSAYMEVEQKTHAPGSKKGRKPKEVAAAQPSPLSVEVSNVTTEGYSSTQKYDSAIHRSESYEYSCIGIEYKRKKHGSKKSSKSDVSGPGTPKKSPSKLKDHTDGESVQAKSVDADTKSPVGVKSPSKRGRKKVKGLENVKAKSGGEGLRDSSLADGPKCEVSSTPIIDMDVEVPDASKNEIAGALENVDPEKGRPQATNDNVNDNELDDIVMDNAQKSKENEIKAEKSAIEEPQTINNNDNVSNNIAVDKTNDDQMPSEMGISTSSVHVTENTKPHDSIVNDPVNIATEQKPEKVDMDVESAETADSVNNQVQSPQKPDSDPEKQSAIVENVGTDSEQNRENEYGEIEGIEKGSPDEFDDITFPASFLNSPQSDKSLSLSLDKSASRRMDFNDSERGEYDNGNADSTTNKSDMVVIDEQSIYAKCDGNDAIKVPEDKPLSPIMQCSIKEEGPNEQKENAEMNVINNNMEMQKGDVVGECDIETSVVVHNLSTHDDEVVTENGGQDNTSPIDLQNDFVQSSLVTNASSAEQNMSEYNPQGNIEQNVLEHDPQDNTEQNAPEYNPQDNIEQNVSEYKPQDNIEQNMPEDNPQDNIEQNAPEHNPQDNIEQNVSEYKPQDNIEQNMPEYNLQDNIEQNMPEDNPQDNIEQNELEYKLQDNSEQKMSEYKPQDNIEQNAPEYKPQDNIEQNVSEYKPQDNIEQKMPEDNPQDNIEQNMPEDNPQDNIEQNVPEYNPQDNIKAPSITPLDAPIVDVAQVKDDPTDQSNISPIMCPHSDVTFVEPIAEANGIGDEPQNVISPNDGVNTNTQNDPPKADAPVPSDPPVDDMNTKSTPPHNNSPVDTNTNSAPKQTRYNASEDHSLGDTIILPSSLAKSVPTAETRTVDNNTQSNVTDAKSQYSTSKAASFAQNSTVKFNLKPLINLDFKKEKRPADNQLQTIISNNINPAFMSNSLSNNAYNISNNGDDAIQNNVTSGYNSTNDSQDSIVLIAQGDVYGSGNTSVDQQYCFDSGQKMETNYFDGTQMQSGVYQNTMYSQTMDCSYSTVINAGNPVAQQINSFETGNVNNGGIDPYLNMDAMNVPTQGIAGCQIPMVPSNALGQGVMPQYNSYGMYTDNAQVGYTNYSGNYPVPQPQSNVVGKNVMLMDPGNMRASQSYESSQGFGVIYPQNGTLNPQGNGHFAYPQQRK